MRPSRLLVVLVFAALAANVIIAVVPMLPAGTALAIWGALGIGVAADALITPSGRTIEAELTLPGEVFTGEAATISLSLRRSSGALPGRIAARITFPEGLAGSGEFDMAGPRGKARVTAVHRGVYAFRSLWLRWPSRFGLLEIVPRSGLDRQISVVPNIRPVQSGSIDVKVRSTLYGVKENVLRGEGSEFHQLREFTAGMDPRNIDWKRSARRRDLVAKEMRAERNHQIILALDNGYLMREEIDGLPKIDHAVNAALSLTWAAGLGGDLVGFFSFDAEPRVYLPPQPGRAAFPRLRSQSAALAYSAVESNHTLAMTHLNGRLQRRSLIVVFADFVDTTTAELLVENVQILNRSHLIVFVALRDPALERRVRAPSRSLQSVAEAVSAGELLRERRIVLDRLTGIGVLCVDVEPRELTAELVSTYLTIKAREMI
ncbi:MAG: DUF58 domain-containing protein [Paracoccaceae bacterium]